MSRSQSAAPPPCYALVHPGLEAVAAEEIETELGGEVKKSGAGIVVFRVPEIDERVLQLRTTEDVFLLAWGSDQLTHRAEDLERIRRWTAREADWPALLRIHHALRPKPKGRPTYHLVAQMEGRHGYLRRDARKALAQGLAGTVPESWRPVEENAAIEFWLTIHGATAVCGLRLSDRTMRHRTYKLEHRPASLRPTIAAAMIRLAEIGPRHIVLDPMCGAGTLLAERLATAPTPTLPHKGGGSKRELPHKGGGSKRELPHKGGGSKRELPPPLWGRRQEETPSPLVGEGRGGGEVWGGDIDFGAVRAAAVNLRRLGSALLTQWDAARLPLPSAAVDRIVSNPPFGKQLSSPEAVGPLYQAMLREYDRVLRPGGLAVLIVSSAAVLRSAARAAGWKAVRQLSVRVLGQPAVITVWRKPDS